MPQETTSSQQLLIQRDVSINAPAATVFAAILEELGPGSRMPDGTSLHHKLEPWPGGRWFRDMGHNTGHLWGHVQVIKPPTLLEICGPLFMSYPALNHVQYRITEANGKCTLSFTHRGFGDISQEHRTGVIQGWEMWLNRIQQTAERDLAHKP